MELGLSLAPVIGGFFALLRQIMAGIKIGIPIAALLGALWYWFEWEKYKHTIIIRQIAGSRRLIVKDKFKVLNGKDGTITWRLRARRQVFPVAKPDAIDLDTKGKMWVECYELEAGSGSIVYAKNKVYIADNLQARDINEVAKGEFEPLSSADRAIIADQYAKSEESKKKNFWRETLPQMLPYFVPIILVLIIVGMWGSLIEPAKGVISETKQMIIEAKEMVREAKEIQQGIQHIESGAGPPQGVTPPE